MEGSHLCKNMSSKGCIKQGKHIFAYVVYSEGPSRKGVLGCYKGENAKSRIEEANGKLDKSPFTEHEAVATLLRKAVECIYDEIILKGCVPTKYSTKKNRIDWGKLENSKNLSPGELQTLKTVHDRLSGGKIHNGGESGSNPIGVEEFKNMVTQLRAILSPPDPP